ncbi:MAG: SurA N-terminal domain-containing protein, partial [Cyclobacteriaceae bacterium]|nr:SurA N-terminal domain-containing protein [Cyclobacteriaceae bacterium]
MGKIVVAVVAFSMFAFILTDLLQSNSMLFNGSNEIGDIAGTSITYQDFQAKIDQLAQNYAMTTGQNPSSDELELLRQQAWQSYITENVLDPEFKKLGITVSNDEIVDMVQGQNIHPQILQYFSDPN